MAQVLSWPQSPDDHGDLRVGDVGPAEREGLDSEAGVRQMRDGLRKMRDGRDREEYAI